MVAVRYEWIKLGRADATKIPGISTAGIADNVIADSVGTSGNLTVTTTATASGSRPAAPVDSDKLYARLTAIDGPVHVVKGTNPTATLTNGLRLVPNVPEVLAVKSGDLLSFIGEA
ncbi:hypothetical protein [Rhizobium nepotum]|uniref:hypothetical protein n=1 Tax=Rhizobium nepotum TaxID=1035271 RepID=UPI003CE96A78